MQRTASTNFAIAVVAGLLMTTSSIAQINWTGGDDEWNVGTWNEDLFSDEVFGRTNGMEIGSGELSNIVNIADGNVTYDPNTFGDFRFKPAGLAEGETERAPGGVLNITNGSLSMNTASDQDGKWSQFDGDELNLDNGTFRRTYSDPSESGGALIFGSWRSYENQEIKVNVMNGSTFDNSGQVWFGAWDDEGTEHAPGLAVNVTVDNGTLDFKGGLDFPFGPNAADADLIFINGWLPEGDDFANGGGTNKGERYSINFTGPGTMTVSEGGIVHAVQDEFGSFGDTDITLQSYEYLWNQGILQARGFSGAKGAKFGGFFEVEGQVGDDEYTLISNVTEPTPVVWDGGDGEWNDVGGKWNGGQVANDVFARTNGVEIGSGEIGYDVHINDGTVSYDPNAFGDFRFRAGGTLNLDGGSLTMNTASDVDGKWTEFDGDAINISNGTLSRTQSDPSISGGAFILGSWRSYDGQSIEVNLTEGGRIENHGQLWFGAWGDNAAGLEVTVTIDDGTIDLTGGNSYDLVGGGEDLGGPGNADLVFINGFANDEPKDEKYVINFTGPGSITVDSAGIINPTATSNAEGDPASYGDSFETLLTYEDLWEKGILQANGVSGIDGMNFGDFFSITGTSGEDDYMLMSLLGGSIMCDPNSGGDLDGDGAVGFPDFLILSASFGQEVADHTSGDIDCDGTVGFPDFLVLSANFGTTLNASAAQSVPEPSTSLLLMISVLCGLTVRRRR